jgi:magnesium-protoporphyrin IX monomethyl ester (oxidative) cyclase
VLNISERVKKNLADTKIVIGGLHPTLWANEILENCPSIDAVMLGEADLSFPALFKYYFDTSRETDVGAIEGVVLRVGNDIMRNPKKQYIENLDELPMPGYEFIDLSKYKVDTSKWITQGASAVQLNLLTSRSCPNRCNFCAMRFVMGDRFRVRSARHVFDEIKFLHDTYGVNYFKIMDDNFTFDKKRTIEICDLIVQNNVKAAFDFSNGLMVRTLDEEVIDALCRAGGTRFYLAIESGSEYIRNKILHKNCSEQKIFDVISMIKKHQRLVVSFFLIGFPEETEETLNDTFSMIEKLEINTIAFGKVMPFPGTDLFEQCMKDNLFVNSFDVKNLWKGNYKTAESGAADFFIKPYNLSMDKLYEHSQKIEALVTKKNEQWYKRVGVSA